MADTDEEAKVETDGKAVDPFSIPEEERVKLAAGKPIVGENTARVVADRTKPSHDFFGPGD